MTISEVTMKDVIGYAKDRVTTMLWHSTPKKKKKKMTSELDHQTLLLF